jgi:hypothetical protein
MILFSRRKSIKEQFETYCKKETKILQAKGNISKSSYIPPGVDLFIAWLLTEKDGNKILKEIYTDYKNNPFKVKK